MPLLNQNIYYCVYNSLTLIPILSYMNPVHILLPHSSKWILIFSSQLFLGFLKWLISYMLSVQHFVKSNLTVPHSLIWDDMNYLNIITTKESGVVHIHGQFHVLICHPHGWMVHEWGPCRTLARILVTDAFQPLTSLLQVKCVILAQLIQEYMTA
jgi:hypothetical protein